METTYSSMLASHFAQAAGIPSPWRATKCNVDDVTRVVHIWITRHPLQVQKRRNWLGVMSTTQSVPAAPASGPDWQWRHLNCMDYTCVIHTVDQLDARYHDLPWFGQSGLPFTNRMARHVFMCLMEGMEMSALCAMLNIPFTDLWKFKFALDNGHVKFDYVPAKKSRQAGTAAANILPESVAQSVVAAGSRSDVGVPDATNPVWDQLISGDLDIQIKTLSFQLILTKLRQQVSIQQSDEVKLMKLRELHRYVERNARSLDLELKQIRSQSQSEPA